MVTRSTAASAARRARRALALGAAVLSALVWLVWLVRPQPTDADAELRAAYSRLEGAPVPVEVVGALRASAPRVELSATGYVLTVSTPDVGDVTIAGQRDTRADDLEGAPTWQTGDVVYALRTAADPALIRPRVVGLAEARRQLGGAGWDTPVLYLLYLPALLAFGGWTTWTLLARPSAN